MGLGWSVLVHPPYSPDLAPSDFHLLRSLHNVANNKIFSQEDLVKMSEENLFCLKQNDFYLKGINKLPDKCQVVIENNDEFTID